MFILTDPTLISINHIQKAHKRADSDFNDVIAQLYQDSFKTQEKAKYEHIKQAKEKALEKERKLEEILQQRRVEEEKNRIAKQEPERIKQERTSASEDNGKQTNNTEQQLDTRQYDTISSDWSSVSPEQASSYMSAKTGVSASKWLDIIYKESSGNPYVTNPIGCYGLLQINQSVHGNVSSLSPQAYLDKAISIYQSSGGTAWQTW